MGLESMGSSDLTPQENPENRQQLRDLNARLQDDSMDSAEKERLQKEAFAMLGELPEDEKQAAIEEALEASLTLKVTGVTVTAEDNL